MTILKQYNLYVKLLSVYKVLFNYLVYTGTSPIGHLLLKL